MKGRKPDVIVLGHARPDALNRSTAVSFSQALASQCRVFYIELPFSHKDFLLRRDDPQIARRIRNKDVLLPMADQPKDFYPLVPPAILPVNAFPSGLLYDFLAKRRALRLNAFLEQIIQRFEIRDFILLNIFNPFDSLKLPALSQARLRAYYCVDDIRYTPWLKRHGPRLEARRMAEADLLFFTSSALQKQWGTSRQQPNFLLPNAADVSLFSQARNIPPKDSPISEGSQKIVLYIGSVDLRLDMALLEEVIPRMRKYHFVFVGPIMDQARARFLKVFSNVSLLGPRAQEDLPAYCAGADCAIIPFVQNPLTEAMYPLKVHEYQAAGLPIVATPFSEDIRAMRDDI
ncbi:MAG: glycosyltransferase, partial [Bacteroidota bacterium]